MVGRECVEQPLEESSIEAVACYGVWVLCIGHLPFATEVVVI